MPRAAGRAAGARVAGVGAEVLLNDLMPGMKFLVRYLDDDVWHERLALYPFSKNSWMITTPDKDTYVEDFEDGGDDGPSHYMTLKGDGRPSQVLTDPVYRFAEQPSVATLRRWIRSARRKSDDAQEGGACLDDPAEVMTLAGDIVDWGAFVGPRRVAAAAAVVPHVAGPVPARPHGDTPAGSLWLCSETCVVARLGDEVSLDAQTDWQLDSVTAVALRRGTWLECEWVRERDVEAFVERVRSGYVTETETQRGKGDLRERFRQPPLELEPPRDLRDRLRQTPPELESPRRESAPTPEEADARTLWVDYDEQGVRFKPWKQVVDESRVEEYADFPLDGPPTLHHLARHMERNGGDPRLWLQIWIREKKLEPNDRVVHEMKSLVDMIYYGGTYDQLNLGGIASLEFAARRLQLIVDAYTNPTKPNWENAKLFSGQASPEDCISPSFRAWMVKRSKDEADIQTARVRARDARGGGTGTQARAEGQDIVGSGGLPGGENDGGRGAGGRNRRGRGVPPAEKK